MGVRFRCGATKICGLGKFAELAGAYGLGLAGDQPDQPDQPPGQWPAVWLANGAAEQGSAAQRTGGWRAVGQRIRRRSSVCRYQVQRGIGLPCGMPSEYTSGSSPPI